jgi:hypothetical protein
MKTLKILLVHRIGITSKMNRIIKTIKATKFQYFKKKMISKQ